MLPLLCEPDGSFVIPPVILSVKLESRALIVDFRSLPRNICLL